MSERNAHFKSVEDPHGRFQICCDILNKLQNCKEDLQKKKFQIEVAKTKYDATLQQTALHDPQNILIKK